jgi:multiple sugar transport system substrate-binding protein
VNETFNAGNDLNIHVNMEIVPGDAWAEKLKAAQAVQEAPDVLHYAYNNIVNAARLGEIMPLTNYVSEAALNDIYPAIQEMITYNGEIYAYPELAEPAWVLYYWKDKFVEAGLDPEKPPVTMDELIEYARALTTDDTYGLALPANAVEMGWTLWGMRYNVSGHRLIDDNWENSLAADESYYQIAEFYKTVMDEELAPLQPSTGYADLGNFMNGEVAMKFCGSWGIGQIRNSDTPEIEENIGVAVSPTFDGNQDAVTASTGGWNLCIDGLSDNPEAAGAFIEWYIGGDPEIMVDYFKTAKFGKYPVRQTVNDALAQDEMAANDEWYNTISQGVVPYAVAETIYPFDINIAFGTAIERVYLEGMSPEESFAIADEEIQDIIVNQEIAGKNPAMGN